MVRREDDRRQLLRAVGAEVVVGDLLEPADVYRVVSGCRRVYFGMSVSAGYLEATVTLAVVAREVGVDAVVNMSQMTVSQMSIRTHHSSGQQRQHWLSEQRSRGRPAGRHHPTDDVPGKLFPLAARPCATEAASWCHSDGARPLRLRRLMSPGWSLPFSPTPGRIWPDIRTHRPRSQDMHGVARGSRTRSP